MKFLLVFGRSALAIWSRAVVVVVAVSCMVLGATMVSASAATTSVSGQSVTPDVPVALDPGGSGALSSMLDYPGLMALDSTSDLFVVNGPLGSTNDVVVVPAKSGSIFGQSVTQNVPAVLDPGGNGTLEGLLNKGFPPFHMHAQGVSVDAEGDLFIMGWWGNGYSPSPPRPRIVVVPAATRTLLGQALTANVPVEFDPQGLETLLQLPDQLVFDGAGNLYVADQNQGLVVLSEAGGTFFGTSVSAQTPTVVPVPTDAPDAIALTSSGVVVIGTCPEQAGEDYYLSRIPGSTASTFFGQNVSESFSAFDPGTPGSLNALAGGCDGQIAFDRAGNLFTAGYQHGQVIEVPASTGTSYGQSVTQDQPVNLDPGGAGLLASLLNGPYGLVIDASDNLFVANQNTASVYVLPASGPPPVPPTPVPTTQPVVETATLARTGDATWVLLAASGGLFAIGFLVWTVDVTTRSKRTRRATSWTSQPTSSR